MDPNASQPKRRENVLSTLNVAIETSNLAKELSCVTPAKAVFGSVSVILTMIRDSMINQVDYVELGITCADVCIALDRGLSGKLLEDLNDSVCEAISQLTMTVAEIQKTIIKRGKRSVASRLVHAKSDKETIAAWRADISRVLLVFNTELAINTHVTVSDIRHNVVNTHTIISDVHRGIVNTHAIVSDIHRAVAKIQEEPDSQNSIPGESPPPLPRACFGRGGLIEKIVSLAEQLTPLALIGAGGIGKTSIALAVLHNDRIKQRFGKDRRFIRCDQFPASCNHLLSRLCEVIGAGAENPEDLTPLRPFLSSKEMIIVLDNAESILDPQGANAEEIYNVVEELSQFSNICLCITSRISTIPPECEALEIPILSMGPARDTFYRIYKNDKQPDLIDSILEQLEFHPLSITLLATVAHHNKWDTNRLTREWERQRTGLLHTQHNKSLAATVELSLASPMFQELGPDAQGLLAIVAFFPQGIDENNLGWLFSTIPDRTNIFDKFCVLSLTYRSSGFITMLAPLRDHLCPKVPMMSPFLQSIKECYFSRLSVHVYPGKPGYEEAKWVKSEDVNIEHLLDVFTSIDASSHDVWDACACFMRHLYWHKPRLIMLGPKIEWLPDDHQSKPECLLLLSWLFDSVGNHMEYKRLLIHTLKLQRERRDNFEVAQTLRFLAGANRELGLRIEGMLHMMEALEIYKQIDNALRQAHSTNHQLNVAEEAASCAIDLSSDEGGQFMTCHCHLLLGRIFHSKGEIEKAMDHLETALRIASPFNWQHEQLSIFHSLADLSAPHF